MLRAPVLALITLIGTTLLTQGQASRLTANDIAQIKRICSQLPGIADRDSLRVLQRLTPYLRTKNELDHLEVNCHSQHCNGGVSLRDDAEIFYDFLHVPSAVSMKSGDFDDTPDIEIKGNNRIESVALVQRGRLLYSKGELPPWFDQIYLKKQR
jgi:hypothetical protein